MSTDDDHDARPHDGEAGATQPLDERAFMERWRLDLIAASDAAGEQGNETAEWLGISKSAYYRRRRGEMPFTAYEFVRLSRRFGLDITVDVDPLPRFEFDVPLEADAAFSESGYLRQLEASAQLYAEADDTHVLVSATDIPIFYLFGEPDLAALKRYLFGLAIDAKGARRFDLRRARTTHARFIGRVAAVARAYRAVGREEAWGPSPLRSLIYQILLLVESAAITPPDCATLFDAVERVVERLERSLAERVAGEGALKLWQNRLHATSSIVCVHSGRGARLFVTFDNPNFFVSDHRHAIEYFVAHFEALRKRSLRVAGHGAMSPARYCAELKAHVARGRARAQRVFGERDDAGDEL